MFRQLQPILRRLWPRRRRRRGPPGQLRSRWERACATCGCFRTQFWSSGTDSTASSSGLRWNAQRSAVDITLSITWHQDGKTAQRNRGGSAGVRATQEQAVAAVRVCHHEHVCRPLVIPGGRATSRSTCHAMWPGVRRAGQWAWRLFAMRSRCYPQGAAFPPCDTAVLPLQCQCDFRPLIVCCQGGLCAVQPHLLQTHDLPRYGQGLKGAPVRFPTRPCQQ